MTDTLSIDAAVDAVLASEAGTVPESAPDEAGSEAPEIVEGDDIPGGQPGTDEAAETPAEDAGGVDEAPAKPAAEAPNHWSAEGKAAFAALPPETQAVILAEAQSVEKVTAKKLEETAAERRAAKEEREKFSQGAQRVIAAAEKAEQQFAGRWEKWTPEVWSALAQQDPAKYTALKAQFDADQASNQQIQSARKEAEEHQHAEWLEEQREALATLAPALVDPVKGEENRRELFSYLTKQGATKEGIEAADAVSLSIAHKAMLYDAGIAKLTKPTQPAPPKAALKPSGTPADTSQQRTVGRAKERFERTGSIDDAVEVLLARKAN